MLGYTALCGRGSETAPVFRTSGAGILNELIAKNKKVIGISFGNPYILESFPQLKTYIVAYGNMPYLQRSAIKGLFGMQDITGRLPISLPGLYPIGTGITIKRTGVSE